MEREGVIPNEVGEFAEAKVKAEMMDSRTKGFVEGLKGVSKMRLAAIIGTVVGAASFVIGLIMGNPLFSWVSAGKLGSIFLFGNMWLDGQKAKDELTKFAKG